MSLPPLTELSPNGMAPWPRRLVNFPIILIAIVQQFVWAFCLLLDPLTQGVTAVSVPALFFTRDVFAILLFFTAIMATISFSFARKWQTILGLLPQQVMLFLSAAGALEAIEVGTFADGVVRSRAFLLVDQCPALLIAFFHTWAIFLLIRYAQDRRS